MSDLDSDEKIIALWQTEIKCNGPVFSSVEKAQDYLRRR
jgi:hypothetical protein